MRTLLSVIDRISLWSGKIIALLILPTIGVIVYTVFMRYILHQAPVWGFEVSIFLYGMHIMLGGAYCLHQKSHVVVDVLPRLLPDRSKKVLEIISSCVILVVSIIMAVQGSNMAWESTKILERSIHQSAFNPQIWWFKWVIPISAGLVALQALKDLIDDIHKCYRKEK